MHTPLSFDTTEDSNFTMPLKKLLLKDIQAPITLDLQVFEGKFKESVKAKVPLLDKVMYYVVQRKGKQMRPMFVFFAANKNLAIP